MTKNYNVMFVDIEHASGQLDPCSGVGRCYVVYRGLRLHTAYKVWCGRLGQRT